MKTFSLAAAVLVLGLSMAVSDAEAARRLGGGKSSGMQRQNTTQQAPAGTTGQTPASPNAATAAAAPAAAGAAGAAAAQSKRSWMGPLAGIAAGLGLAALASHLGLGEAMGNMLMIGLLVMAGLMLVGFIMRRRAAAAAGNAGTGGRGGLAYAGAGMDGGVNAPAATSNPAMARTEFGGGAQSGSSMGSGIGSGIGAGVGSAIGSGIGAGVGSGVASAALPADFDEAAFVRNAKVQFIRLQAANDAGNLEDLRQFTTPEMFAELKMDLADRGTATSQTDVVAIDAKVLAVEQDGPQHVVSVHFSGSIREDGQPQAEPFAEIWHLTKPMSGSGGWLLSGIQQVP